MVEEMEGGEYIVAYETYLKHKHLFDKINLDKGDESIFFDDPEMDCKSKVNCNHFPIDKILIFDFSTVFIINKYSTHRHFKLIEKLCFET